MHTYVHIFKISISDMRVICKTYKFYNNISMICDTSKLHTCMDVDMMYVILYYIFSTTSSILMLACFGNVESYTSVSLVKYLKKLKTIYLRFWKVSELAYILWFRLCDSHYINFRLFFISTPILLIWMVRSKWFPRIYSRFEILYY